MKNILIICTIISTVFIICNNNKIVIPKDSIRYRIIANSNSNDDQKLKWEINKDIIPIIDEITKNTSNKSEIKTNINNNIVKIRNVLDNYNINYDINYGNNYFPKKEYDNISYKEGNYESLVITLGDGKGKNWWCVMFPPLCLMEAKYENDFNNIEYKSYIKEIIHKY